jgi:hypothetical protein
MYKPNYPMPKPLANPGDRVQLSSGKFFDVVNADPDGAWVEIEAGTVEHEGGKVTPFIKRIKAYEVATVIPAK